MKVTLWLLAAALSLDVAKVHANFDFGLIKYQEEDYRRAHESFYRATQYGHNEARYNLGVMYLQGQHVERDWLQAYAWLSLAYVESGEDEDSPVHQRVLESLPEDQQAEAKGLAETVHSRYSSAAIWERLRPNPERFTGYTNPNRPVRQTLAEFPRRLARAGAEGWSDVRFTIDEDGNTRDHYVIHATHEGFGQAAIDAVRSSVYEPIRHGSHATAIVGVEDRVNFFMTSGGVEERVVRRVVNRARNQALNGSAGDKFAYAYQLKMIASWTRGELRGVDFDDPDEWFWRSATMGHDAAAYMLGSSMLNWGDIEHGELWLLRAAEQGLNDAAYLLGMEYLNGARLAQDTELGLFLLARAARSMPAAQVRYAWILSTYPDDALRDADLAAQMLDGIDRRYPDKQGLYQARAALAAETGDFQAAVRWQERALADAEALGIRTETQQVRLKNYQNQRPWRESM